MQYEILNLLRKRRRKRKWFSSLELSLLLKKDIMLTRNNLTRMRKHGDIMYKTKYIYYPQCKMSRPIYFYKHKA
jgi:hypothetical protein